MQLAARAYERDRYLTALLAPARHREALIAIAAFAGEVARIPAYVNEPMMGHIRLQWWRDTIDNQQAGVKSGHPVADALAEVVKSYGLQRGLLTGYVDAQEIGLASDPPADDSALATHLAKTEGALFELAARVLAGADVAPRFSAAISLAGRAYGIARLMVELPAYTAEKRTLLPGDRLVEVGLDTGQLYADPPRSRIFHLMDFLAEHALGALSTARADFSRAPRAVRQALLPVALVEPYLQACQKPTRDPLRDGVDLLPVARVARLWWASLTGRI